MAGQVLDLSFTQVHAAEPRTAEPTTAEPTTAELRTAARGVVHLPTTSGTGAMTQEVAW